MTDVSELRDYGDKHAWLELQADILDVGPDEIDAELFANDLPRLAASGLTENALEAIGLNATKLGSFRMTIIMNDKMKRELQVLYRTDAHFVLFDDRLARAKTTNASNIVSECSSWMQGWKHMRNWRKV